MNLIKMLRVYRRASQFFDIMKRGTMNKSLFRSRTFWFNLLTAGASIFEVVPVPPETAAIVISLINIGLRLLTTTGIAEVSGDS
tara:strand:- start:688 stop:939 length:252 start_codon:yes stop_codon:yes gene_type:complete